MPSLLGVSDFPFGGGGLLTNTFSILELFTGSGNVSFDNVLVENEFYAIQELCQGYALLEQVNSSNIAISCGLVLYILQL